MRKAKIARLLSMSIFATAIFGAAAYADATNINVGTQEDWYTALATMHQSTNSEFYDYSYGRYQYYYCN